MKQKKKGYAILCLALGMITAVVMGLGCYYEHALPDVLYTVGDASVKIASKAMLSVDKADEKGSVIDAASDSISSDLATVRLWGIIPVKSIQLKSYDKTEVSLGGTLFGIKLFTDGVLVVDIDRVTTDNGRVCPALDAGIKEGDCILTADGIPVSSNAELRQIICESGGVPIDLLVRRNGREFTLRLKPARAVSDTWRGGIWVRDSTAGIGTLTCYDAAGRFVGLGHGIYDVDTGTLLRVGAGSICEATLTGIVKGCDGSPGKLEGIFTDSAPLGSLLYNSDAGIGGVLEECDAKAVNLPIALRQEVKTGKAYLCCMLDEEELQYYEVKIEKVDLSDGKQSKNMVIRVTDERLLEKTGGIVQGMSGSPIIQDGKLIGAVTHVFVNNAKKGYGIFIENMLDAVS